MSEGDSVEGFYALKSASLNRSSRDNLYVRMELADMSGSVQANMWETTQDMFLAFSSSEVVKVRAFVESYRGKLQLKVTAIRAADEGEYDPSAFVASTPASIDELKAELDRLVASVEDADYRALLDAFFMDEEIRSAFCRAPAAKQNHHAYLGGLLEHTVSVTKLAETFCASTPCVVNRDLLIVGSLLHDIGKIRELAAGTSIDYTDEGKLLGHLIIGTLMVREKAEAMEGFPRGKEELVMHMILSHHGKREYGSPILPAISEALALHHLDNLDAKTVAATRMIAEDIDPARRWTERSWMLETQLFKGWGEDESGGEQS